MMYAIIYSELEGYYFFVNFVIKTSAANKNR